MARKHNDPVTAKAELNLSHDGRGVIKHNDKVYFVAGVLAGEEVIFTPMHRKRGEFTGRLEEILSTSEDRVEAPCEYFGVCGGCSMQHLSPEAQIKFKAQTLKENMQRIGKVEPEQWLEPMQDALWHYRRKARPGVKFVPKKGGVIVGFRERASSYLTSLKSCLTMTESISDLLPDLHILFAATSISNQIPQVEVAAADNAVALIIRHLEPFNEDDLALLTAFGEQHKVQLFLQPGGLKTIHAHYPLSPEPLFYALNDFGLKLEFLPSDFLQVNAKVNEKMIAMAIDFLELGANDKVLDLFCGLGNFTLPLASKGAAVLGVEGEQSLVDRAKHNASLNNLENAQFECANLHLDGAEKGLPASGFNKLLIDPPRSGAELIVNKYVPILKPELIVYVSCNPATLARDSAILVSKHGYVLEKAGAIDMFPHTAHVESIAVFRKGGV
ncbi:MAG: 23S rRNA (uracil(1939)-C(5))-methyltransferase RlmD [Arenicellales bacterium]